MAEEIPITKADLERAERATYSPIEQLLDEIDVYMSQSEVDMVYRNIKSDMIKIQVKRRTMAIRNILKEQK